MRQLAGAALILLAAWAASGRLSGREREHIALLEEGVFRFRRVFAQIRERRAPLPDIFGREGETGEGVWREFFARMAEILTEGTEAGFSAAFGEEFSARFADPFSEEELWYFLRAAEGFSSLDEKFCSGACAQLIAEAGERIAFLKNAYRERKRLSRALCLSGGALLIILLL